MLLYGMSLGKAKYEDGNGETHKQRPFSHFISFWCQRDSEKNFAEPGF
jgi:hypothetical protein